MIQLKIINSITEFPKSVNRQSFVEFLYNHLEQFGDSRQAINRSIDYAFSTAGGKGGFLIAALENDKLVGALVMNATGMKEYIPENYLIYVAVHADTRNQGLGSKIIEKAVEEAKGDIALHVEYDNPAKHLYEQLGFESKYAEMRKKGKE